MNYRHHFHAGNFADVAKHVLLVRLVRSLQQKPKGFLYLDTHAGRGAYDLAAAAVGDSLARTPEWPDGVGRLWERSDLPPAVAEYVALVREFDRGRGNLQPSPRFYPGSPWIARWLAREQDRLLLCERHPGEAEALRNEFRSQRLPGAAPGLANVRVIVQELDGYEAMRATLPPAERRALVLVDPPYEAQDEFALAVDGLAQGLRRLPGGVFALWYPLTERARVQEFLAAVFDLRPPPTLIGELTIADEYSQRKMIGCGMLVVNPPWRFDMEVRDTLAYLAKVLAQEPGASHRVSWLVPEK